MHPYASFREKTCHAAGRLALPEQKLEAISMGPAQSEAGAIFQKQVVFAMEKRLQLLDPVNVDDRGPVDADEPTRIQSRFEEVHSLPKQMRAAADVKLNVIVIRFDPIDVRGTQEENSA